MSYQADFLNDGTASADSFYGAGTAPSKAFDNSTSSYWLSDESAFPHWIKYDLGASVVKMARKLRVYPEENQAKDFKLEGSQDDSIWVELLSDALTAVAEWNEWTFDNYTAYRYYKITVTSNHTEGGDTYAGIYEIELMEAVTSKTKFNRGFN